MAFAPAALWGLHVESQTNLFWSSVGCSEQLHALVRLSTEITLILELELFIDIAMVNISKRIDRVDSGCPLVLLMEVVL